MGVLEDAERVWTGELSVADVHPLAGSGQLAEVADGVAFLHGFGNVTAISAGGRLALVDTGPPPAAAWVHSTVRGWRASEPLDVAVYTHGHLDHVYGTAPFEEEAATDGRAGPRVIAHENLPARFDRYKATNGWNALINRRQFGAPGLDWPTEYRYPDETYRDALEVDLGGERLALRHAMGETDDATWVWLESQKVLCVGDLFVWSTPNAGNPQKVQRYPAEWAEALREMVPLGAEVLLPGHGWPIVGAARIQEALTRTAELLESLLVQTISIMNGGGRLDDALHGVTVPERLASLPYLQPVYDEPEFVVRTIWRRYGGWWDGNPATLKPSRETHLAAELASLAGGARRLAERARELADGGDLRLAGHLAETARLAAPGDAEVLTTHAEIYERRARAERSTMAKGPFDWAAEESRRAAGDLGD